MLILAFETSAKAGSVALLDEKKLLGESYQNTGLTHSQTLLVMAEELLKSCGHTPQEVTALLRRFHPGSHGIELRCLGWLCVPGDGCPAEPGL